MHEVAFKGRRFSVVVEDHQLPIGKTVRREYVVFPETVMVLPIKDNGRIVLVHQYRAPIRGWIYEVPAGVVEPGENLYEAAKRELLEETGYIPGRLEKVLSLYLAPGYSTERIHGFIATNLSKSKPQPEEYEVIRIIEVTLDEALEMIRTNKIMDSKSVSLILYYYNFIKTWGKHNSINT